MLSPEYYMEEGCGIFAVALSRVFPGGTIGIISDTEGVKWDEDTPELTHVFYESLDGKRWDVKGERTAQEMAEDFNLFKIGIGYDLDAGNDPKAFMHQYMGNGFDKPLYGEEEDVLEAIELIKANPELYGLLPTMV